MNPAGVRLSKNNREGFVKKSAFLFLAALFSSCAMANDIDAHCKHVAARMNGNSNIEASCHRLEEKARDEIAAQKVEPDIDALCKRVGKMGDDSYQLEAGCRRAQADAKEEIANHPVTPRIDKYCQKIKNFSKGSYQMEAACHRMEETARDELAGQTIPPAVSKRCERQASSDSYQLMSACVRREMSKVSQK